MTIRDIIERAGKSNNSIPDKKKIQWLSELDFQIYEDIIQRHEGAEQYMKENDDGSISPRELPYTEDSCTLIAPERFSKMYEAYLRMEIDLELDELDRYSNDMLIYNEQYDRFSAWYNETHMPLQPARIHTAPQYQIRSGNYATAFK